MQLHKKTDQKVGESVDKVAALLAEMPLAENLKDFRTALYSRQYHPRTLENR